MRPLTDRPLDVFIDLTGTVDDKRVHGAPDQWPLDGRLTVSARQVTCASMPGAWRSLAQTPGCEQWRFDAAGSAINACTDAIVRAARDGTRLLVLHGPVNISDESVLQLRQAMEADPLFASAVARTGCESGCCLRTLAQRGLGSDEWVPRRVLPDTPETEIGPECVQPALLIAPEIIGEFGPLADRFSTLSAALLYQLARARRCGYRTVVANRAIVTVAGGRCGIRDLPGHVVPETDRALARQLIPDLDRARHEYRAGSSARFEVLSGRAHRAARQSAKPSLLLDIRNVIGVHNGTTHAVLGSVKALRELSPQWDVSVLANRAAVEFHRLSDLCRGWDLLTACPDGTFTAALRLSQPWHIQEMVDLHDVALFNVYYMLDTISWDVIYAAPKRLDGTWSFLADHADGYLFDSAFTERRFLTRFNQAASALHAVCHYPFAPEAYVQPGRGRAEAADSILVIGNDLDHKDVVQTVDLLATAFPFTPLVCFGPGRAGRAGVRVCPTGSLPDEDVHRLYASARFIVLPSFYEGFGFPVVTGLAYGKTVIARRSELLDEIARHCTSGRLIAFARRDDLVQVLGRLMHGERVREEPLGAGVSGAPRTWADVGADIVRFLETVVSQPSRSRWRERDHAVNQLLAFRG